MARKKKIEEPVNEEFKAEELPDELKERIDEVMDVVGTQTTSDNVEPVSTSVAEIEKLKTVDMERLVTLKKLKDEAMDEIHRCSAYVFSGRDKAFGRVFELSRTEWCDYYIALEYCERKPDAPLPRTPSHQIEPK